MKIDYDLIKQIMVAPESDFAAIKSIVNLGTTSTPLYYLDRGANVLGIAHMDSVVYGDCAIVEPVKDQPMIISPMCDDRVGVAVLLAILPKIGIKCDVLLSTNEEIMQPTSREFEPTKKYNWMFMFDRSGTDAVTYQYNAKPWVSALNKHFTMGRGTYSDIADMDHVGCSGVNIGTGYYGQHSAYSFTIMRELLTNISRFAAFYHKNKETYFEHKQEVCESCGQPLSRYGYCLKCHSTKYLPSVTSVRTYNYIGDDYEEDNTKWKKGQNGNWIKVKLPKKTEYGCCVICYTKPTTDIEREHLDYFEGLCEECRHELKCKICGRNPRNPDDYRSVEKWGFCVTCNYEGDDNATTGI